MRTADIKVGTRAWCNVGDARVEVEVLYDSGARGRRYFVKRTDNGKPLHSRRAASALHASALGLWGGAFDKSE